MEDKIGELVSVLGVDSKAAKNLLEASGGNLEMAVNMHLEGGGPATLFGTRDYNKTYEEMHGVRAPIPQTQGVLIEDQSLPFKGKVMRSRKLPQTVFDPTQDYSTQVNSKTKELAKLFEPPLDLMFQGSFDEARHVGREQKKWLLVNIQDSKEFASQVLNRDLWKNAGVKDLLKKHFIFWQVQRITDGGMRFKQLYHITTFPCIAIIDPRTGEKLVCWDAMDVSAFLPAVVIKKKSGVRPIHSCMSGVWKHWREDSWSSVNGAWLTIVDECEESQLEAAIRASLAETQASSKPYYLVDSDDQCSPVVSSDESDEVVCGRRRRKARGGIHSSSSEDERVTSPFAHHIPSDVSLDPLVGDNQSSSAGHRERGKKRHCSFETNGELPRKLLKQIVSSRLDDTASEQCESAVGRKGKERAGSSGVAKKTKAVPLLPGQTLEEQLASGAVSARDVAVLLVRLPDGTRVEKAFNRTHPIQELFDYLSQQHGVDITTHEVVTHFPKLQVSSLSHSATFKEVGLCPRATVFIQHID
eukprot:Em0021g157a